MDDPHLRVGLAGPQRYPPPAGRLEHAWRESEAVIDGRGRRVHHDPDERRVLELAGRFATNHPELLGSYLTHTFGIDDVQGAFDLACRPVPEREAPAETIR